MPIKKITEVDIGQSFMQVNLIQGYKYIDRAGEIVNFFYSGNKPPRFQMSLSELVIFNPEEKAEQMKVSPSAVWASFQEPDSLEYMNDFYVPKVIKVMKIMDVTEISRVGWRSHFVYELDKKKLEECFKKFSPITNTKVEGVTLQNKINKINLSIRLNQVISKKEKPFSGILIDVDFFQDFTDGLSIEKIPSIFLDIKNTIRTDDFLALINSIITENGK